MTSKQIKGNAQNVNTLKKANGYGIFSTLANGEQVEIVGKSTYFTPRAVLRIGMLLRDSEVAKEVRTQPRIDRDGKKFALLFYLILLT